MKQKYKNNQSRSLKDKLLNSIKITYTRFLKIRGNAREIALGLALGLFIGMTPFMGFHTAIAVFLAAILKWNKISSAIGVWITNPISAPFIYSFTYYIGAKLLFIKKAFLPFSEFNPTIILTMTQKAPKIIIVLTIGGIIVGLPLAIFGYYFSYSAILKYREKKKNLAQKREQRKKKRQKKRSEKRKKRKKKMKIRNSR